MTSISTQLLNSGKLVTPDLETSGDEGHRRAGWWGGGGTMKAKIAYQVSLKVTSLESDEIASVLTSTLAFCEDAGVRAKT